MKKTKPDIAELITKIQEQLVSLDRKIDTLINRPVQNPPRPVTQVQGSGNIKQPDRDHGQRPLFKAVCAECHKECEVPFRPSQDRPVYCKECFARRKAGNSFNANRDNRPPQASIVQAHPHDRQQSRTDQRRTSKKRPASKKRKRGA